MFENLGNIGQLASGIGSIFGKYETGIVTSKSE